jgi:hypothetical protein
MVLQAGIDVVRGRVVDDGVFETTAHAGFRFCAAGMNALLGSEATYADRDRVIKLLLLESAEPRAWDNSWKSERVPTTSDRFRAPGQYPFR